MLDSRLGRVVYLLVRNDLVWRRLSHEERARVLTANAVVNTTREDWSPETYGGLRTTGSETWDSDHSRQDTDKGTALLEVLSERRPRSVLEVGPGSGFYTRTICECDSVTRYTAIDINGGFLEYLRPRLDRFAGQAGRPFSFELICDDFRQRSFVAPFDLVVLLSTVHHIPDRVDLFAYLCAATAEGGAIFCYEPSHYLPRLRKLVRKCLRPGYPKAGSISTHHMCSFGEFRKIARRVPDLALDRTWCVCSDRVNRHPVARHSDLARRWMSYEIGALFGKKAAGHRPTVEANPITEATATK